MSESIEQTPPPNTRVLSPLPPLTSTLKEFRPLAPTQPLVPMQPLAPEDLQWVSGLLPQPLPMDCRWMFERFPFETALTSTEHQLMTEFSQQAATPTQWHTPVEFSGAAKKIFDNPDLVVSLCDFCRCLSNLKVVGGQITSIFCSSCRCMLSHQPGNECHGGSKLCDRWRFVNEFGETSRLCHGCHQANAKRGGKKKVPKSKKVSSRR